MGDQDSGIGSSGHETPLGTEQLHRSLVLVGPPLKVLWGRGPDGLTLGRFPLGWEAWASWETGLGDWGRGQIPCKEQDDVAHTFPFSSWDSRSRPCRRRFSSRPSWCIASGLIGFQ